MGLSLESIVKQIRYNTRIWIGLILLLISVYTVLYGGFVQLSTNILITILTAVVLDGLILRHQKKRWVLPYSAVITGFLVGLILNPSFLVWQFSLVTALAIFSKYLILPGKKHIFNPAAFGLLAASFIFADAISWWGVSWSMQIWIFVFIAVGYVLWRLHRLWLPIGFLLVYWTYLSLQGGFSLTLISDPTVALFAFIMLPEPQTASIKGYFKYTFGILVATVLIIESVFFPKIQSDPLLISLTVANLIVYFLVSRKLI